ncbi:DUF222 domain-containing protein [uncultured Jatrophihabitans sp.]|uniref:DUF222 domain-containing protein n=1 Tax=uncultured Jatrophihabitans sp. TaxID=1610747 RepID=UPI0035CC6B99
MFDTTGVGSSVELLAGLIDTLSVLGQDVEDVVRIDRIALLEKLKSAASAAQAVETVAFATSQRAQQIAQKVPAKRADRGIAAQIALARRTSPYEARRLLGWSRILITELPQTFATLQAGDTTEWRAMIVARETAWLSREHRAVVDEELAAQLEQLGNRRVESAAKTAAYRLDPEGYVGRIRGANSERRVSVRPAPDVMSRLSALLPVAQGVACQAALSKHADTLIGTGDSRTRGQIMADTLVERVTGQAVADDVAIEINLVMTDETLFAEGDEPGRFVGHAPIPAPIARAIALRTGGSNAHNAAPRWIRRIYTALHTGQLIAVESRRRRFTTGQRRFIDIQDDTCRTPWCDAPIRHYDHVNTYGDGGPTSVANGRGACVACNLARQAPGWHATAPEGAGIEVILHTPTDHRYPSRPPKPPARERRPTSPLERVVIRWLRVA